MQDSEKQVYYDIITRCWGVFKAPLPYDEFSDVWWEYIIQRFDEIREFYKNTNYSEFADRMAQIYLDENERRQK